MSVQATVPQLTVEIDSAGAVNTIYVTADASVNDLTLTIKTNAKATLTPASQVVDLPQASSVTGSLLYLNLTPLNLTAAEFAAVVPASTGWTFAMFPTERLIGMTPTADRTLEPGKSIKIAIGALADAGATGASASLSLTVFRVGGITIGNLPFPTNFSVALATPPDGGDALSDDLVVSLATPNVVNTIPRYDPVLNQLAFAFLAGPRGRPVKPVAGSTFTLSFVYATDPSGYGALCTAEQVQPPFAVVAGINAGGWAITPHRSQESPSWTLKPPTTGPIVSPGHRSTVGILVNNVITEFQPGPTVALISYSGFPGYADGVFTVPIEKVAHVRIDSLTVRPNPTVLDGGTADVTIAWQVADAGTMTLAPFQVDVTGKTSYPATITDTTQITLTAEGRVLASAGNYAVANAQAVVLPVINSFDAAPRAAYQDDWPREVQLSWNVDTNEMLELVSSVPPPDPNRYGAVGTVTKLLAAPQMLTLVPLGQSGGPTVERSIVVSAFTPRAGSWPVKASFLAAPPNASFVLASDGIGTIAAVDTMVYQSVSGAVPAGKGPAGMVFSADGSVLYVANSGDVTVSAIAVEATNEVPQYTFAMQSTISVGGAPQRLALSPDGAYLYVSVDGGSGPGRLVVIATSTATVVAQLTVGVAPRGVAVMASGAQLFVANSGTSTVTVVGRTQNGVHSVVNTVTGLSRAQDVAVTPDDSVLLAVCPGVHAVIALNALHPQAPRATIAVGASPQQIALIPGGAYAVVTNGGDGTASLLATGSTPATCDVLDAAVAVGASPGAVVVTPDAGLVLVGNAGSDGLCVITLAEYETAQPPPPIGGQPTDVVVSPDTTHSVAWHDARIVITPGTPSTGLFVYEAASQTVTPQLTGTAVVDFAYHPQAAAGIAFLVQHAKATVTILSTATWTASSSVDISGQTAGLPFALAATADGASVFCLASDSAGNIDLVVLERKAPGYVATRVTRVMTSSSGSTVTLAVSSDGAYAYVTDEASGNLVVVARTNAGDYELSGQPITVGSLPVAMAISPDDRSLYMACMGWTVGSLAKVDTTTLAVSSVTLASRTYSELADIAVGPDGTRLFATDRTVAAVRVFDAASLRLVQTITLPSGVQSPSGIAVAPDGSSVFTANTYAGTLGVIAQVQAGAPERRLARRPAPLLAAAAERPREILANTAYQGLFLRDYVGQTPQSPPTGTWTDCPDIWPSGSAILPNPQATLVGEYGQDSPNVIYTTPAGGANFVYVRGLNATNGPNTSRVWLYYVNGGGDQSLMLWPIDWLNAGIVSSQNPNVAYIDVSSKQLNEIDFTQAPFLWDAVPVNGHYCMIAWVQTPPGSDPRQGIPYMGSWANLAAFVQTNPQMGWKNTQDLAGTGTWTTQLSLAGPPTGGLFYVGLTVSSNLPTDGTYAYSIVGPPGLPHGSISVPTTPIPVTGATPMQPLDWGTAASYQTQLVLTYTQGPTAPPPSPVPFFTVVTAAQTSSMVGLVADPLVGAQLWDAHELGRPDGTPQQTWLTVAGMVKVNIVGVKAGVDRPIT